LAAVCLGTIAIPATHRSRPIRDDDGRAVFELVDKLIGNWEGVVGKSMKVAYSFTEAQDGKTIVAHGVIGVGMKKPLTALATMGWDPVAKQVYYLDQHGSDTIYFGHVTREGDDLVFDFNALSGDTGHYRSHSHITADSYTNTMAEEDHGQWKNLGFHVAMRRVK
jgi:hypothetical protein